MSSLRNALRCIFFALVFTAPLSAYAVNYDVRVFFDTDSNRATGCTIPTANGPVAGVEQVLTTSVTVNGGTGTVTGVTRQQCINGLFFGDPVPVNGGWNVGVSPTGNLFIETHVGANVMTIANISTMRLAFTVTSSGGLTDAMTTDFGDDILYPVRPSRRHAVSTGALRTIHLDGIDTDWAGVETLASGDAASPALRFLDASAYADISDLFFNFRIQTNANAPTALDDFYALGTVGGTLSVSTLGVLNNDSDPNHLSLSAFLVEGPEHGTLTLNANGGFTYTHDGSSFFEDHFRYRVTNGTLESNLATVTISLPGSHPYTFTSADHVTFTAGQLNTFHVTVTGNPTPALSEDGVLPSGITFTDNGDGTGTLSGTPAAGTVGTYPIVFHAEKNKPHQTDQNFTLTVICSAITVTNPLVNTGTINTPFSQTFTQSGGASPITWSKTGALPAGLTFNASTGVLSGTPTQSGTFPITVTATDTSGCTGTGPTYTLTIICNSITVTNPVTTSGTVNVAFSQTFTQSGGVGTTTFSLASGTLPAGLTLNPSTGVLSGTPTQKGSFPIVVRATDSHGCAGDGPTYPLNIGCQVISVTNPATNTGTVNVAFSQTFTSGNAIAPVVFSLNSGTLPAGITLNASTGVLSGTPTQTGSFPITIKATDANGCFGIGATYTLTIGCQVITVTNPGANTGTVNVAFSQTFTAGNAIAPVTFSLNSGTLPAGITLNASTGVLSGTPTQTGSFPITIKATDANGCFGIGATYTLTIGCQVITVNNPGTNSGTVNAAFSQTFTAGNTIGATTFTTASTLPTGLTLSTAGVLSGTPTQKGSFPIVVHVVDANGCSGNGATYTLIINCQVISVTNPATTTGIAGTPFSQTFTQTGGFGATTFSTASALPAGLTLSSGGLLSGTPTQTGSFPIVVTATDANGCTGSGATYTLVIGCQTITVTNPLTTTGTAGTAFSQTFTQSGGIGTTTFSTASLLPAGLTLSSGGVLSGTPTQTGSFPIVVTATDSNGCTGSGATYTLVIGCQTITVTNPGTTTGIAGTAFSQTFTQSSAIGGATFTLNGGSLPAGLTLHPNGVLDGTPTVVGSFPMTVKVTDGNGCTGVGSTYTLVIGCQTITVTNPVTTTGTIQVAFSQTFTQSGAIGGATFSINSGTLPAGLTLHSATGVLDGTPTVTGSFPISVLVTDGNGCTGVSASYNLVINCQTITVTNPATTTGTVSAPFTQIFTQTGANGTATFTTASTLPAGLSLATDGTLSGTPTQPGTFPIVVTVTDSNGCTGTGATYTLIISCQTITVTNPAVNSGAAGAPFSQTFTQVGGIPTITWSESGALPTGLTFHTATGVLDGTPNGNGLFPITVTATDSNGCTGTGATYNLTITCPTITVTNPGVNTGTAGTAFSQTFTQSGGQGTISWSATGTIPIGIALSPSTGVLSGTTNQVGTFPITVTATDQNGCTGNSSYTLTINCQTVTVTNPGVNTGTVDAAFSQTFTVTGILGTVTWSETGALPAGITLNSASGVLSGTPTVNGSFPITVKATDTNGCFGTSSYTLTINCQTITVTKPGVTTGTVGAPFSQTFTQTGAHGTATFTTSSTLPAGLSLSTAGVLSGTPTVPGCFPIVVTVTDSNGCTGISTTYTLCIACQTITVTNPATTTGTVNVAFSQTFTQSGASGTATFTTASTLPTGFSLSTAGVLSGTTNQHGTFPIVVTVTDANGCTGTGATYNLVINCQTITVTNPATTTGTVSAPFTQTFTQTGANGTATFTTASTLPAGLSLAADGTLSGTPTQPGTFPIVVTVTDSNGCTGTGATYTLIISCQTITVTNPAVNSGAAGAPFSQTFTQTGGIGTTTFSESGTLPTGLTFHTATGVLDGTPSGSGSFPITVTATDSNGCTGTGPTYTLTITCPTITVTNPGVSTGTAGAAFSQTFTQSGGQGTIAWSETGALPSGISLNTVSGVLSGTTSQVGTFPITVTATDVNSCTGTGATYNLTFNCQTISITNPGVNTGTVDAAFCQTFTATGILGTATWSETGALPSGITLNSSTGALCGTPSQPGSFPITVKVTDTNGCFTTSSYALTINCQTITVTKPVVTTGTVDAPFSQTFTQSGVGTHTPATFTLNSGSLPSGLTLSTAGVLSGTPGQPGSFPITVKVTDANGCTGISTTYTLNIACQTITVTNPATTTGTVAVAFSQTFTQSGVGTHTPATFTTASTLPTGFSLSAAGVLSGTTNQHGTFPIIVTVTDVNGCTGTGATYNLVISCQTITVTNPGVNTGTVGTPFSQTFTQIGANGGATFTTASALPTGITLSTAGLLSGTPLQAGSFPIVVTVTDGNGCTGTGATYTLVIACNVISVTNPGVTTGTVDAAFSQTFTQSGGNGTITWSKTGAIPAGMTFHTATGVLDGTPSVPGSFPITVTATDSNGCTGTGATYTLVIACQTITVNNPGVTTGTVDAAFSQTFTQSGVGTHTPATFTLNSGSLPSGLSLSTAGVLSGTPGQPGSFPITVKVTDANGCTGISATYTLVIACQTITVTNPLTTSGVFNAAFSQTFTQSGVGTHTPATFTLNSGSLPTGLSLSTAGVLSGTPTQTGTFPITVKVTDANGCTGISATYNLAITPSLGPDSYSNLVDNTQAIVTGGATASPGTPFVSLTGSVLANDLPAGGVSVTAGSLGTTAGGTVIIASDGTFIYTPAVHAAAITTDSFTYTATSNTGGTATPTSANGTVTLNLAGRVWYVKNNGGGTNGQSQSPFTTLAAAAGASTANDIIFVYNGDGTNSGQNAGISLKNGQQLLGEVNGLIVNAQTLVAVGSRPTIGNSGGDGVTVAATAASLTGVFIKGFSIAGTANGINLNSSGANTLTATVDNVVITAATANNGIKIAGASTTTTTATVQNSTVSAATQNGIDAQQTSAGNLVLNINNDSVTATGVGINVNGAGSTSTSITNFATNTVSGNTGGNGIVITSATFDGTPGGVFQTVSGGNTVIGSAGNGVGGAGMVLTNVAGDLSFTDLDIVSSNGAGLFASGTTPYTGSAGFQIAVASGVGTIDATNGPAADLNTVTANLPWSTIKSTNSASTGVSLVTVPGTFTTTGATSSVSNATSTDFNISGGNATVTYDGTITDTTGRAVSVASTTGGTKTFSGAITNNGGTGISLTNNTGATINFSGTIILSTGSSDAFTATGGGTVSASDTSSTITTTTGIALNVANTTIGAANLKFKSITAGTAASGPSNGILLNTTGSSGGLIVSGTGSAGSGGTIQKTTGAGISLTSTKNVSLSFMIVETSSVEGIVGTGVDGFTLASSSVINNSTAGNNRDGVKLTDTVNAVSLTNNTVTGNFNSNFQLTTSGGSSAVMTTLTVTGGTYSNSTQNAGFLVDLHGTAALNTASVSGATFSGNFSKGIQFQHNDNCTMGNGVGAPATGTITINNNTITNNDVGASFESGGVGNGSAYYRFTNNATITGNHSLAVNFANGSTVGNGAFKVFCDSNHIGTAGVPNSGAAIGEGIRLFAQGKQTVTAVITNNVIRDLYNGAGGFDARGIDVEELGSSNTGQGQTQMDVTITGNNIDQEYTGATFNIQYAIYVACDGQASGSGSNVRADIHGNTVPTQSACDSSPCSGNDSMAWMETVSNSNSPAGALYNLFSEATVNAAIVKHNTGPAGTFVATQSGAGQPAITLTATPPNTVN